jgi:hypothetical protein
METKTETKVTVIGKIIHVNMDRPDYPKYTVEETGKDQYPAVVTFDINPQKTKQLPVMGDNVEMSGYVGSRLWNGKYFTGVRCTFCKILGSAPQSIPNGEEDFNEAPF